MVEFLAGCHKSNDSTQATPSEAELAVSIAKSHANTNGCENPTLIKARLSSGTWLVSMRSGTGAIAVAQVSPDGKIIRYDVHE